MKLKMSEDGKTAVVQDGKPIYIHDDGKEIAFDAAVTLQSLNRTLDESKKYKERAQTAEAGLKAFEGIEDADAARKALDTVKNLDQGQLVTAGKVEEIKAAAKKAAEDQVAAAAKASNEKIKELETNVAKVTSDLYSEKVGGAFSRSKYIADKIAVPGDMVQAMFGQRFKVDNGKTIGVGLDGQPIYSRTRAGEIADFDEALESMVDAYPNRDSILKGANHSGSGARGSNGGGNNGAKSMSREAFDKLDAYAQRKAMIVDKVTVVD